MGKNYVHLNKGQGSRSWKSAVAALSLSILAVGCTTPTASDWTSWRGGRVQQFKNYEKRQNWKGALATVREEIANPASVDPRHLAAIRLYGLKALAYHAKTSSFQSVMDNQAEMDDEALRFHREGVSLAANNAKAEAGLSYNLAYYYSVTGRNGLAIPYTKKDLAYNRMVNDRFRTMLGYDFLAAGFHDQGELGLRDYYSLKALEVGEKYFRLSPITSPAKSMEWRRYKSIIFAHLVDMAEEPGSISEIKRWWAVAEPIVQKFISPKYSSYLEVAEMFSVAKNITSARDLFLQAKQEWEKERVKYPRRAVRASKDFICSNARIELEMAQFEGAVEEYAQCDQQMIALKIEKGANAHRLRGRAHEGAEQWKKAIQAYGASISGYEGLRSSYNVTNRSTFFRSGPVRRSYAGLIRTTARRAAASSTEEDFWSVVTATERIRARQFGDILGHEDQAITPQAFTAFRKSLADDTVVLDYIVTDQAIVVLAFSRAEQAVQVLPINVREFTEQIKTVAKGLADPSSDLNALHQQLTDISQLLLTPVASLLKDKSTILVLPDGPLNLLPFDLLTLNTSTYRPLIQDMVVRVVPSLRSLHTESRTQSSTQLIRFLGLGDPIYATTPKIGELSTEELRAVTRGDDYLGYFSRLPETRTEVESIAQLFDTGSSTLLLGEDAMESKVKATNLAPYRYVHLATHGILGGEVPGIGEPALVLGEESGEDGFLKASEVEDFTLNADLTVLSACKTGTGEYVAGEGVMGMSRAFLVAGSRAVLVSLWSVESKATEELMVQFYRYLGEGQEAAHALRLAKLDLMKGRTKTPSSANRDLGVQEVQPRDTQAHHHPAYWAPFILVGR